MNIISIMLMTKLSTTKKLNLKPDVAGKLSLENRKDFTFEIERNDYFEVEPIDGFVYLKKTIDREAIEDGKVVLQVSLNIFVIVPIFERVCVHSALQINQ